MHSNSMPQVFFDFTPKKFIQNMKEVWWKIQTSSLHKLYHQGVGFREK